MWNSTFWPLKPDDPCNLSMFTFPCLQSGPIVIVELSFLHIHTGPRILVVFSLPSLLSQSLCVNAAKHWLSNWPGV